jgi:hypothetical protein
MNTLQQIGASVGLSGAAISLRSAGNRVSQLTSLERTSMRAMITALQNLPPPPPPPPHGQPKLTISVTNQATAFFRIANVAWSIERQELNGTFTLVASPSEESTSVVPPTLGEYHIHDVVSVHAFQLGEDIDTEFRGNTTINGLHTQLVVWTGVSLTENFRLFAEPPSGAEVNPVVSL